MTFFAWKNYENYAWEHNNLNPISRGGSLHDGFFGETIIDGLETISISKT